MLLYSSSSLLDDRCIRLRGVGGYVLVVKTRVRVLSSFVDGPKRSSVSLLRPPAAFAAPAPPPVSLSSSLPLSVSVSCSFSSLIRFSATPVSFSPSLPHSLSLSRLVLFPLPPRSLLRVGPSPPFASSRDPPPSLSNETFQPPSTPLARGERGVDTDDDASTTSSDSLVLLRPLPPSHNPQRAPTYLLRSPCPWTKALYPRIATPDRQQTTRKSAQVDAHVSTAPCCASLVFPSLVPLCVFLFATN